MPVNGSLCSDPGAVPLMCSSSLFAVASPRCGFILMRGVKEGGCSLYR